MSGINRRPSDMTESQSEWFERTPKWVMFELLRDFASQGGQERGWLTDVKRVQDILKANGII